MYHMQKTFKTLTVIIAFFLAPNLFAQEFSFENEQMNLAQFYDSELIKWDYGYFGGLKLSFQNKISGTFLGVNAMIRNELLKYPDTYNEYKTYRGQRIAGNILLWSGISLIILNGFLAQNRAPDELYEPWFAAFGIQLVFSSPVLFILAKKNLFDSVNLYNRHKINEYNRR